MIITSNPGWGQYKLGNTHILPHPTSIQTIRMVGHAPRVGGAKSSINNGILRTVPEAAARSRSVLVARRVVRWEDPEAVHTD